MNQIVVLLITILLSNCSHKQLDNTVSEKQFEDNLCEQSVVLLDSCWHCDLSNDFNIQIRIEKYNAQGDLADSCAVRLLLFDKSMNEIIDTVSILPQELLWYDKFIDCNNVLSYSTKINIDREIVDNDYGDIIIVDLNFDNKDDIVIKNYSGGNAGPWYSFFLQENDRKFKLNEYLTDSMTHFPNKIDVKNKTLTTYLHGGVCSLYEHIYKMNNGGEWYQAGSREINICDEIED